MRERDKREERERDRERERDKRVEREREKERERDLPSTKKNEWCRGNEMINFMHTRSNIFFPAKRKF